MSEMLFKRSFMKRLRSIPKSWFFSKEALSIRGIPDIIGVVDGKFIALELKRDKKEAEKTTGRIALQKHNVNKVVQLGGFAAIVYPENADYILDSILEYAYGNVHILKN
jgi:hypothetical protein